MVLPLVSPFLIWRGAFQNLCRQHSPALYTEYSVPTKLFQKKKEKTNNVPVIYCNDIFIALNSKFNPLGWVAVTDKEDGDITNKVMAIYNNVNTSIEGNYHVTYEVVDSDGSRFL